ncbi:MAG TPA: hypothetical protein VMB34_03395 [Acetobacteraceae bacterium]|nr:hypothetical protein [Acetobacteraceae bacterium]
MKLTDIDRVNHLITELGTVKELNGLVGRADPADLRLFIAAPGDASLEMSAEGAESPHHRGFAATPGFLAELKQRALAEITARRHAIISELAALGVDAEEPA